MNVFFLWAILWPKSQQPKYVSMAITACFKSFKCFSRCIGKVENTWVWSMTRQNKGISVHFWHNSNFINHVPSAVKHVIIIELKCYLQVNLEYFARRRPKLVFTLDAKPSMPRGPISLTTTYIDTGSRGPRDMPSAEHNIKLKWKSRRCVWWFVRTNNECAD